MTDQPDHERARAIRRHSEAVHSEEIQRVADRNAAAHKAAKQRRKTVDEARALAARDAEAQETAALRAKFNH
jgi:hypothetical protein